jgi:hypothetical protein
MIVSYVPRSLELFYLARRLGLRIHETGRGLEQHDGNDETR